jgi:membrane-bound ClpP family serine protease
MRLDVRLPIGLMFSVLGLVLVIVGLIQNPSVSQRSLGVNINLWWGVVMLAFGVVMFLLGRRGTASVKPAEESPEGKTIEERERRTGLEEATELQTEESR